MSRFFVTGATGFLGTHLVTQLAGAGHEVVALARSRDAKLPPGVTVRFGDVMNVESMKDAAAGCDGAFHCAGLVSRDQRDAEAMYRVHVDGTRSVLTALAEAGVRRVVVASTSGVNAVSARPDHVANEDTPPPTALTMRWPYYRSKHFAEGVAMNRSDLEVVVVSPSLLLGPGDIRGSSTEDVRKFLERKVPFTPGGGIAFVDARDAAAAMVLAIAKGQPGRRYLVNAANMTLAAFFGRLERLSGVEAPPLKLPTTSATLARVSADLLGRAAIALNLAAPLDPVTAEMAQFFWYCDATRAKLELGWDHRDPSDTLHDTIADLQDRGVVWPRS
jgi:dihydroflavonol-4-reductase